MFCTQCGAKLKDTVKYCAKCGCAIKTPDRTEEAVRSGKPFEEKKKIPFHLPNDNQPLVLEKDPIQASEFENYVARKEDPSGRKAKKKTKWWLLLVAAILAAVAAAAYFLLPKILPNGVAFPFFTKSEETETEASMTNEAGVATETFVEDTSAETEAASELAVPFYEQSILYTGKCGTNLIFSFDETTGILTIDGSGYMYREGSIPWADFSEAIKTVDIHNGATGIRDWAFSGCDNLTSVTIPDSVEIIGKYAFNDCFSLTSVTIYKGVKTIGESAFSGCINLTEINIPRSVEHIEQHAFSGCDSLICVTIPDSVKSIGRYAFSGCDSLTNVTIKNGVKTIGEYAFFMCRSLPIIEIPRSVVRIEGNAFFDCASLKIVKIYTSNCIIDDDSNSTLGVSATTVIYAPYESTAHAYAMKYSFAFQIVYLYSENNFD